MARKEAVELSEYEKQRQANIAERDALLKQLALDAAAVSFAPKAASRPSTNGSKTHKKKTPIKKIKEEIVPRRTSSRLAGLTADSEVAKRKADDEYVAVQEAAQAKRQRVSGPLDLSDIVVAGKQWNRSENFLVDMVSRGAKPYERTFGEAEVKQTSDKELRALREKMSGLQLYEGFEPNSKSIVKSSTQPIFILNSFQSGIKITPERIYSLAFHPSPDKPLIFAGDKLGNLGVFDASQTTNPIKGTQPIKAEDLDSDLDDDLPTPNITSFHLHTRTISSFQFSPLNPSHLYTSSYDSSLRLLDLTASTSTEIYGPSSPSDDEPLSGIEVDPTSPHILYFSRLDGFVGRTDTRSAPSSTELWQLSEKKIGGFSLHPRHPHFLATASLDRFMKVWDLRKISGKDEWRVPALVGEHESRLSVSHAAFNSAGQVATASYDDTIKIHSFHDTHSNNHNSTKGMGAWEAGKTLGAKEMAPSTTIRHNNQTGRWVTM